MKQHYPVEENTYKRGSAIQCLGSLVVKARRRGIAQNLNHRGSQMVRVLVDGGLVTAVLQPVFVNAILKQYNDAEKRGAGRELALSEEVDNLSGKLSGYRAKGQTIADSRLEARRRYENYQKPSFLERAMGNVPGIYRCLHCRRDFGVPGRSRIIKCGHCGSERVRRVK